MMECDCHWDDCRNGGERTHLCGFHQDKNRDDELASLSRRLEEGRSLLWAMLEGQDDSYTWAAWVKRAEALINDSRSALTERCYHCGKQVARAPSAHGTVGLMPHDCPPTADKSREEGKP